MREKIEKIGYYLSCMLLFNVIYALSIIADDRTIENYNLSKMITFIVACVCSALGLFFSIKIMMVDDAEENKASTGKKFEVISVKDLTGENYFANFSVIVLTGVALPSDPNWFVLTIFLLIEITLGVVYTKKQIFYMNPILALMDYSIYECMGRDCVTKKEYDGVYYFLIKGERITQGKIISYKNINSHVIRLNMKNKGKL